MIVKNSSIKRSNPLALLRRLSGGSNVERKTSLLVDSLSLRNLVLLLI